jgi:hypothetical protein
MDPGPGRRPSSCRVALQGRHGRGRGRARGGGGVDAAARSAPGRRRSRVGGGALEGAAWGRVSAGWGGACGCCTQQQRALGIDQGAQRAAALQSAAARTLRSGAHPAAAAWAGARWPRGPPPGGARPAPPARSPPGPRQTPGPSPTRRPQTARDTRVCPGRKLEVDAASRIARERHMHIGRCGHMH